MSSVIPQNGQTRRQSEAAQVYRAAPEKTAKRPVDSFLSRSVLGWALADPRAMFSRVKASVSSAINRYAQNVAFRSQVIGLQAACVSGPTPATAAMAEKMTHLAMMRNAAPGENQSYKTMARGFGMSVAVALAVPTMARALFPYAFPARVASN